MVQLGFVRVLIDATSLLLRSAGVKSYTWHWLTSLRRLAPAGSIGAFPLLGAAAGELEHERSIASPWATWPRLGALALMNAMGPSAVDAACRRYDLFHASNMVRAAPRRARLTATLHDLTTLLMPELHTAGNIRADEYFAKNILRRAHGLIAVSENTKRDAVRLLGIAPERIEVIYSGVDDRFFKAKPLVRERPYVLFLGAIEPRKNVDVLLDAWEAIPSEFTLLIAGPPGWKSESTIERLRSGVGRVFYLGYVPEADIPALTAGAAAFAYPSLYEGFGFPVAQAMAAGVPVVTSNTSCLPEIVGEGGICVDPRSAAGIAAALNRILGDASLRAELGAAGRLRAQAYRWDECARRSLDFFRRVAAG